jgi:hypothetical protein
MALQCGQVYRTVTVIGGSRGLEDVSLRASVAVRVLDRRADPRTRSRTVYTIASARTAMTEFDPEKFEEKYVYYFEELEEAYSAAYQQLHGQYDSAVLRAIDQQVLSESEPFYEGSAEHRSATDSSGHSPREHDGEFRVELPENPRDRVGAVADHEQFEPVLDAFVDRIEVELRRIFEFDETA